MKIVHLCLACFFPDGYAYQENMLPKFHKAMGCDVEVIASRLTFDAHGKDALYDGPRHYRNEYDIPVTRLDYRTPAMIYRRLRRYVGTLRALEAAAPDILFIHGCQFMDIDQVAHYLRRHPGTRVYVDNHADFSNSATNWLSKNVLHRGIWRLCARRIEPFAIKFYGVLPARVDFLKDIYGLPPEKCALLVMGVDDGMVERTMASGAREIIRAKYGILPDDFLVMTGGKIDQWKKQTLLLMEAVQRVKSDRVKLIVFGPVVPELTKQVTALADGTRVRAVGRISPDETYDFLAAADLVVFPGRHSVLWEQAAGQGKPMLVRDWPGTHHIDLEGNVRFLSHDSVDALQNELERLLDHPDLYDGMKAIAEKKGMRMFSYQEIAKRAIEMSEE